MAKRTSRDRIREAMEEYNDTHPDNPIKEELEERKPEKNAFLRLWDKIGKTGQVIALVAGILTGLTTIKPYAEDAFNYVQLFVYSVEHTKQNTIKITELSKYNEVTSSILKSILFPYWHTNPDGKKIKLYKTREVEGKHMTYHFVDCCIFYAANYNIESGKWYYIDDTGGYFEIEGKEVIKIK